MARTVKRQQGVDDGPVVIHNRPADWARSYQVPLLRWMLIEQGKRAMTVFHRKAGKDWLWLRIMEILMGQRPGLYTHVFPTLGQGREIVWDGQDNQGRKFLDVFHPRAIKDKSETELRIELHPAAGRSAGSTYQIMGTDNLQKRRGPNALGVVLSEYQDMPEGTFEEIFEPMVLANDGWAGFAFTPRGKNHAYRLWNATADDPAWFRQLATIRDTRKDAPGESGEPVLDEAYIANLRRRGVHEATIQQEYYCSFDGVLRGTIFGDLVTQARQDGRVTRLVRDVQLPVGVVLDVGRSDGTAAIFYQTVGRAVHVIDYFSCRGKGSEYVIPALRNRFPYLYGRITLPWDAASRDSYTPADTTEAAFARAFPTLVQTLEDRLGIAETIDIARRQFGRLVFDEVACSRPQEDGMPSLLDALAAYRYPFNDRLQELGSVPVHDANSHAGSAMRYGAQQGFTPLESVSTFLDHAPRSVACPWLRPAMAGR